MKKALTFALAAGVLGLAAFMPTKSAQAGVRVYVTPGYGYYGAPYGYPYAYYPYWRYPYPRARYYWRHRHYYGPYYGHRYWRRGYWR